MHFTKSPGFKIITGWLSAKDQKPFEFQQETWQQIHLGNSGLVNAPTGFGKTFSVFLGAIINFINENPKDYKTSGKNGLQLLWITPLRALGKDIARSMSEVVAALGMSWQIAIRNGDTGTNERQRQKRNMPEVLVITPESLHLLLAQKGYSETFASLKIIAVDEWHELLGSKRGVQVELAISRLIALTREVRQPKSGHSSYPAFAQEFGGVSVWGLSATIGNLEQAKDVLLYPLLSLQAFNKGLGEVTSGIGTVITDMEPAGDVLPFLSASKKPYETTSEVRGEAKIITANLRKEIIIESVLPDEIEKFPWSGHLGLNLAQKAVDIIRGHSTTLMFINTRGMSERWYQAILTLAPDLAGAIALHHGSIEQELRIWVEEALHTTKLKAVVCTASLDLGVDFRPVENVIQVGSPKGVARFLQRAGRSGHQPGEVSKIYFLPTHSLELVEAAALKQAMNENLIESREPRLLCFDVLIQYLCTIAISEGFLPNQIFNEIKSTYCFAEITREEFDQLLQSIVGGGVALQQYDEFKKVEVGDDGIYRMKNRRLAMRHRMHIGTIVSDAMLKVKFISGGYIGVIEEYFISRLEPGSVFTLAGRNLELVMIKDLTVLVRKSNATKSIIPSWEGGRMPLSSNLGLMLRRKFNEAFDNPKDVELQVLKPLFQTQKKLSHIPKEDEFLIEHIETKDGNHLFVYPFEGRLVHEAMAAILAYRISRIMPITFSFAMNDYGFELLSDQPIPLDDSNVYELFSTENLFSDIQRSVNSTEMARRKFRDISVIGGLIFQGYPGEHKKARHLQSSASLMFNVFSEYDKNNLLIRQAYNEVMEQQMEEQRLRSMLERIQRSKIVVMFPKQLTPFCFPIKVDSMRESMSSEKLEDRVRKMQAQLEK